MREINGVLFDEELDIAEQAIELADRALKIKTMEKIDQQIINYIADGYSHYEIARIIGVSHMFIYRHINNFIKQINN